jgi:hypothetical protein
VASYQLPDVEPESETGTDVDSHMLVDLQLNEVEEQLQQQQQQREADVTLSSNGSSSSSSSGAGGSVSVSLGSTSIELDQLSEALVQVKGLRWGRRGPRSGTRRKMGGICNGWRKLQRPDSGSVLLCHSTAQHKSVLDSTVQVQSSDQDCAVQCSAIQPCQQRQHPSSNRVPPARVHRCPACQLLCYAVPCCAVLCPAGPLV